MPQRLTGARTAILLNSDEDFFFWSGNLNPKRPVWNRQFGFGIFLEIAAVDGHAYGLRGAFGVRPLLLGIAFSLG